jgi:hypothetical protein
VPRLFSRQPSNCGPSRGSCFDVAAAILAWPRFRPASANVMLQNCHAGWVGILNPILG